MFIPLTTSKRSAVRLSSRVRSGTRGARGARRRRSGARSTGSPDRSDIPNRTARERPAGPGQVSDRKPADDHPVVLLDWQRDPRLAPRPEQLELERVGREDRHRVAVSDEAFRYLLEVALRPSGVRPVALDDVQDSHHQLNRALLEPISRVPRSIPSRSEPDNLGLVLSD